MNDGLISPSIILLLITSSVYKFNLNIMLLNIVVGHIIGLVDDESVIIAQAQKYFSYHVMYIWFNQSSQNTHIKINVVINVIVLIGLKLQ